ncbi:MAG TPA: peptidoglycan DD-metalloendopeptidase family protein, partial [Longimicrobium sp.]|nr:peptidoglycan DD-metalloendopeptidase family protein [Longimicrobium sp.]
VALPWAGGAQQTPSLTESQRRLQEIRRERTQLRGELSRIRSRVGDVSAEIRNIQRQQQVSASLLREINLQMEETSRKIDETTLEMAQTQAELVEKRRMLHLRLRGIYKRGPLHSAQVLLSAQSFSDLLNRYKYLYIVARRDRTLVSEVDELARELENRERELRRSFNDIQYLRSERAQENATLQELRTGRTATLSDLRATERRANARLETLARDERRMAGVIADLERRRREAERRAAAPAAPGAARPAAPRPAASTMTTADVGNLDWPVGGRLVYNFGRATQPNGTTIRYNGVGIGAAAGSPVRAVEAGTVEMAAPFEGYGPTVVVSHGGGYYSLYLYLKDVHVRPGAQVTKGQTIGTVGGETSPEGPHLEFQIREPGGGAVDPVRWLRGRR